MLILQNSVALNIVKYVPDYSLKTTKEEVAGIYRNVNKALAQQQVDAVSEVGGSGVLG